MRTNAVGTVIAPTAALSSFPYAPKAALAALRYFYEKLGDRLWGRFGFADAFQESSGWISNAYIAIDQGPIVAMIENYRDDFVWKVMRKNPYIRRGLLRAGFTGGWLEPTVAGSDSTAAGAQ